MLRETLIKIVKSEYSKDCKALSDSQPTRAIIDIFVQEVPNFSKYKLAKAYLKWCKDNDSSKLTKDEIGNWKKLIEQINKSLK